MTAGAPSRLAWKGPAHAPESNETGRFSGDNRLADGDRRAHQWYRFVLSFPPHLVRRYASEFGLDTTSLLLDPFCGTGTTLVEAKKLGVPSAGIEAHPFTAFAASVKVDWSPDPYELLEHARGIAEETLEHLREDGVNDSPLEGSARSASPSGRLRGLDPSLSSLLLTSSISRRPLHKALVLLEALHAQRDDRYDAHERLAFAHSIVQSSSNLRFGPEVGLGEVKSDAPVVAPWLQAVSLISEDLGSLGGARRIPARVYAGDARRASDLVARESVDAVFTSPPYPNEKDYTRTTRLESVLLGFISDRDSLRAVKRGLVRSNTRGVFKADDDDVLVASHKEISRVAAAIEARRVELGKTSGFERLYPRVAKLYFGGMLRHLTNLRSVLKPGARLAYVVGDQASYLRVMIRTGQLLGDLAESAGYELERIDLFRTRHATATGEQLREEVVVLRWPGEA
ncbi:MAG TPA: DNA methyltransferase [Thermoplasmata archaeon]|nr:DNA methyltransferase [Thermoplasmata archaeon]